MEEFSNNGIIGYPNNPYQQGYNDTCAIKSQQLILQEFGVPVTEDQCIEFSIQNGWYNGNGTEMNDVGNLLIASGIPCSRTVDANIYDLAVELAQGHKVIVGVDSGELWDNGILDWLKDIFIGDTPDHALIVAGIDMTDPDNPMVIVTDPGSGDPAKPYPLKQFMDAWSDSQCFMVSTDIATPQALAAMTQNGLPDGHLINIADVDYDTLLTFQNYSHQIDFSEQGYSSQLYDLYESFPTMNLSFDDAVLDFNMPAFNHDFAMPMEMPYDSFAFDYNALQNSDWLHHSLINNMNSSPIYNETPYGVTVTDIFGGQHHYNSMEDAQMLTDVLSGLPSYVFPDTPDYRTIENRAKLDESSTIEHERDLAVENYRHAMDNNDFVDALKWQNIANSHQQDLYNLWDTPQYVFPAQAPGIEDGF